MYFLCTKISLYLVANFLVIASESDPCIDYNELDDYKRSTAFLKDSSPICDDLIKEGWYRSVSKAGGDMPTLPVPSGRCGTSYPVWIDDTLPAESETKIVKACVSTFLSECFYSYNIKVKNCTTYNVYDLIRTPGCDYAYCFGKELPCPEGQLSENGYSPGCAVFPDIPLSMSVFSYLVDGEASKDFYHKILAFECRLTHDVKESEEYYFDVDWFIEENLVQSIKKVNYSELPEAILTEENWKGYTMGFNVKCRIRMQFKFKGNPGPYYYSSFFYAGLKADKSEIRIRETETTTLTLHLTVPFGCLNHLSEINSCKMFVRVMEPVHQQEKCVNGVTDDNLSFTNGECGVNFYHTNWNSAQTLNITGRADNLYNRDVRETYIRFRVDLNPYHGAWTFATIPDVYITDEEAQNFNIRCQSNNDPHMRTFNSRYYENQRAGEFVMYQHEFYPIRVHAMYTACRYGITGAQCNCGLAIRNGAAIFEANFCGPITTNYVNGYQRNNYIEKRFCDDKAMRISNIGNSYTITLPTGTQVLFSYYSYSDGETVISHIHIKPSILDVNRTSGLCGVLDHKRAMPSDLKLRNGNFTNDVNTFALDWKINVNNGDVSLFNATKLDKLDYPVRQYCTCHEDTVNCELKSEMEPCLDSNITTSDAYFTTCGSERSKRSADRYKRNIESDVNNGAIDRIPLVYLEDYNDEPSVPKWRNGWNENAALTFCKNYLQANEMVIKCSEIVPDFQQNVDASAGACAMDIKLAGSTVYKEAALADLTRGCLTEAVRMENLTQTRSSSGNTSKTLLDDVLDISCVDNCSGNGICNKGRCDCINSYEGDNCNMKREFPPIISNETNTGHCKSDITTCNEFYITDRNFIKANLTCKARPFEILEGNTYRYLNKTIVFPGKYINVIGCSCVIPTSARRKRDASSAQIIAKGYYISVSNDGEAFSDELTFISYDSACYICNTTTTKCVEVATCPTTTVSSTGITTTMMTETTSIPTSNDDKTTATYSNSTVTDTTFLISQSKSNIETTSTTFPISTLIDESTTDKIPTSTLPTTENDETISTYSNTTVTDMTITTSQSVEVSSTTFPTTSIDKTATKDPPTSTATKISVLPTTENGTTSLSKTSINTLTTMFTTNPTTSATTTETTEDGTTSLSKTSINTLTTMFTTNPTTSATTTETTEDGKPTTDYINTTITGTTNANTKSEAETTSTSYSTTTAEIHTTTKASSPEATATLPSSTTIDTTARSFLSTATTLAKSQTTTSDPEKTQTSTILDETTIHVTATLEESTTETLKSVSITSTTFSASVTSTGENKRQDNEIIIATVVGVVVVMAALVVGIAFAIKKMRTTTTGKTYRQDVEHERAAEE